MPVSREELESIIATDLQRATDEQRALYYLHRVEPELAGIVGDNRHEEVWVAARSGDMAVWYDDIEGGWNVSRISGGVITDPGYEQDPLCTALWRWSRIS